MTNSENQNEQAERLLSLRMDGRLDEQQERELDELLQASEEAREAERSFLDLREAMQAEPTPVIPIGLEQRVLDRVEAARASSRSGGELLRMVRWMSIAAAMVLGVALFTFVPAGDGGRVEAGGEDLLRPTIEDELRTGTDAEGSIEEFLRQRITGSSR